MVMVLNEEQRLLKESARAFFTAQSPVKALRTLRDEDDPTGFDRALWKKMIEMGWAGVLVPEQFGGTDFGYVGLGQILEESGRTLAASPLIATALLGATLLRNGGTTALQSTHLPALASGERLCALTVDEAPRHLPHHCATRATKDGHEYIISGNKIMVLDGHVADELIVVARTQGDTDAIEGLTLFIVPATAAGITRTKTVLVDSRNAARITFNAVRVSENMILGQVNQGRALLDPALDAARIGLAAEMTGNGLEAFERTLKYLKIRQQFGVPIGSFQALKHRMSLMYCELELTKSAVIAGLSALDAQHSDLPLLASLAKTKACEMLELVTSEAVQLHGGIGMTDEEEIGFFLKRARVAQQLFGDALFHRERYAMLKGF